MKTPLLIAEVKTKSPFGFQSDKTWVELFDVADRKGDWISIHTDAIWGGSMGQVKLARSMTRLPILAKGIHQFDNQIVESIEAGADYVLVVGRIPNVFQHRCIIEPRSLAELAVIPRRFKVVWNQRNLSDGTPKKETFDEARKIFKGWLCQASYIKKWEDIHPEADAALIGEHLMEI